MSERAVGGWGPDVLIALACAATLGALSLSGAHGIHWSTVWAWTLVACFVVLHATVAVRGHSPLTAYAVACAAMLVVVLAPDGRVVDPAPGSAQHVPALLLPSTLAFLLPLYAVADRVADEARTRICLAGALVGVVITAAATGASLRGLFAGGWLVGVYVGLALALLVLLTWNLGRLARARRARLEVERAETARLAVLEERSRIAREMHDIVAHSLAVIVRQAEGGAFVVDRDPASAGEARAAIADTGRRALDDMRGVRAVLRRPDREPDQQPDEQPAELLADPPPGPADIPALLTEVRASGVDADLDETGEPSPVGDSVGLAAYRVVQEALTNVVKHAGAGARVAVRLDWRADGLVVEVVDDGNGTAAPLPGAGAGLEGLRERAAAVGGTITAEPLTRGFRVRACFPREARVTSP
jgi:signal transduction histidine kinase